MNRRYSVAFIGMGAKGSQMALSVSLKSEQGIDLVCWFDPAPERQCFEFPRISSLDEMRAMRDSLDVIYIATPPRTHLACLRQVIGGGGERKKSLRILMEKPLAASVAEAEEIVALSGQRENNIVVGVNFWFATSLAARELRQKMIGIPPPAVVSFNCVFQRWPRDFQAHALWLKDSMAGGGGFIREVWSHYIYLVQSLFGGAARLEESRIVWSDDGSHEISAHASILFHESNVRFSLDTRVDPTAPKDIVEFECGGHMLSDWACLDGKLMDSDDYDEVDTLIKWMDGDENAFPSAADGLKVAKLVEAILSAQMPTMY